jgi:transcriptional regulator GlxA family with amidase domain
MSKPRIGPVRFDLLVFPQCLFGNLFACVDVIQAANRLWNVDQPRRGTPPFSWRLVDASGAEIAPPDWMAASYRAPARSAPRPERTALIVPAMSFQTLLHLKQLIGHLPDATSLIARRHAEGAVIAGSFTATAMMAEAGILKGRVATTGWMMPQWFKMHYPGVDLRLDQAITRDGRIFCAGSAESQFRLILDLVEHFAGLELATRCRNIVLYQRSRFETGAIGITDISLISRDSAVFKARQWLDGHLRERFSLEETAQAASVSARTLLRHFQETLGMTPLSYLQKRRVERACQLLEVSLFDMPTILSQCGYEDPSAFRRVFRAETGMTPAEYRRAYTLRASRRAWKADDEA